MRENRFNVVVDGQWGSCGKGLIATAIAHRYMPHIISTTNMPNAGHTAVWTDGRKFVAKALPSAAVLHRWTDYYKPLIYIGASAAFDLRQLQEECEQCDLVGEPNCQSLIIHERASVVTAEMKEAEVDGASSTKHIASTMQGCGVALARKIQRLPGLKLARDYPGLNYHLSQNWMRRLTGETPLDGSQFTLATFLNEMMVARRWTMLHEGSQGFSLDINHGSHYPFCTSRSTTSSQALTDVGIAPQLIGDVYLVIRPYPIRVGNVVEDGVQKGYSGDAYEGQKELTWEEVGTRCGAPADTFKGELTTVTKRLRRVFEFSLEQVFEACRINGVTRIALNFANYIDWSCYGETEFQRLPLSVMQFIREIEDGTGVPVSIIGTGPQNNHVIFRE